MGANQSKDEVCESPEYKRMQTLIEENGIEAVQEEMREDLQKWRKEEIKLCVTGMGELENHTLSMPFESTRYFVWYYN